MNAAATVPKGVEIALGRRCSFQDGRHYLITIPYLNCVLFKEVSQLVSKLAVSSKRLVDVVFPAVASHPALPRMRW